MGNLFSASLRLQAFPLDDLVLLLSVFLCALVNVAVVQHPPCTQPLLCLHTTASTFRRFLPKNVLCALVNVAMVEHPLCTQPLLCLCTLVSFSAA